MDSDTDFIKLLGLIIAFIAFYVTILKSIVEMCKGESNVEFISSFLRERSPSIRYHIALNKFLHKLKLYFGSPFSNLDLERTYGLSLCYLITATLFSISFDSETSLSSLGVLKEQSQGGYLGVIHMFLFHIFIFSRLYKLNRFKDRQNNLIYLGFLWSFGYFYNFFNASTDFQTIFAASYITAVAVHNIFCSEKFLHHFWNPYVHGIVLFAILASILKRDYEESILCLVLFILLPVANSLADSMSLYWSRFFLHRMNAASGLVKPIINMLLDVVIALVLLTCVSLIVPQLFNFINFSFGLFSDASINWNYEFDNLLNDPLGSGFFLSFMMFSTLLPTLAHLILGMSAIFVGVHGQQLSKQLVNCKGIDIKLYLFAVNLLFFPLLAVGFLVLICYFFSYAHLTELLTQYFSFLADISSSSDILALGALELLISTLIGLVLVTRKLPYPKPKFIAGSGSK